MKIDHNLAGETLGFQYRMQTVLLQYGIRSYLECDPEVTPPTTSTMETESSDGIEGLFTRLKLRLDTKFTTRKSPFHQTVTLLISTKNLND